MPQIDIAAKVAETRKQLGEFVSKMLCPICDNSLRTKAEFVVGGHKACLVRNGNMTNAEFDNLSVVSEEGE